MLILSKTSFQNLVCRSLNQYGISPPFRDELFLIAVVTAVHKIVESLANFLSPYLPDLLFEVCCLSAKFENPSTETSKSPQLSAKLKAIRSVFEHDVCVSAILNIELCFIGSKGYENVAGWC